MFGPRSTRAAILALGAFLLGAILLQGCQPAQPAATPQTGERGATTAAPTKAAAKTVEKPVKGGTLVEGSLYDFATTDPAAVAGVGGTTIYEPLILRDREGNPTKEGLIKDWTISADGKTITFKLREGVKFHDGTDFDAAAVKFNIDRMKDPATKSAFRDYYKSVAQVEVVDNLTVRFMLSQPDVTLLVKMGTTGGRVASPAAVKKYDQDFGRNPVGTGAFQFEKWQPGDYFSTKRFDGYWRKDQDGNRLPFLDGVTVRYIPDQTTATATLRAGAIDTLGQLSLDQYTLVKKEPTLTAYTTYTPVLMMIAFNTQRPPFNNKALREAIAYAVDRQSVAGAQGEFGVSHATVMLPAFASYYDPKAGVFPDRDLAKAKAKLAEAGVAPGSLKVILPSNAAMEFLLRGNQVLKANLAEVGIEADIQVEAMAEFNTRVLTRDGASKLQILHYLSPTGVEEVSHAFDNFFHSQGGRNYLGPYSNPQVDKLIDKARTASDVKERAALYQEAAKMIREDMPIVPLYIRGTGNGYNKRLQDYFPEEYKVGSPGYWRVWLKK